MEARVICMQALVPCWRHDGIPGHARKQGLQQKGEGSVAHEYRFVELDLEEFRTDGDRPHRAVIEQHARDGWRLVQIFAPAMGGGGAVVAPAFVELVFEKER